jgi:hypothetical protein
MAQGVDPAHPQKEKWRWDWLPHIDRYVVAEIYIYIYIYIYQNDHLFGLLIKKL